MHFKNLGVVAIAKRNANNFFCIIIYSTKLITFEVFVDIRMSRYSDILTLAVLINPDIQIFNTCPGKFSNVPDIVSLVIQHLQLVNNLKSLGFE